MGWADIRRKAREVTHNTFGLLALYTPVAGDAVMTTARLHTNEKRFGDLDREGFAQAIEQITRVKLPVSVNPQRNSTITFLDDESQPIPGLTFNIDNPIPAGDGDDYMLCEVTRES